MRNVLHILFPQDKTNDPRLMNDTINQDVSVYTRYPDLEVHLKLIGSIAGTREVYSDCGRLRAVFN